MESDAGETEESSGKALSARELEVAHLVTEGLSNQEIADELHVALRTVQGHVRSCMTKLGARSRTQVAVTALRRGLVPLHPPPDEK